MSLQYALGSTPWEAQGEMEIEVHQAVTQALARLQPDQPLSIIQPVVDSAVARALEPWRRRKTVQDAVDELPPGGKSYLQPTEWQLRAMHAAREAVQRLGDSASLAEIEAVAKRAVEKIAAEFKSYKASEEDARMRQDIISRTHSPPELS